MLGQAEAKLARSEFSPEKEPDIRFGLKTLMPLLTVVPASTSFLI
jgi:hypothetical protein